MIQDIRAVLAWPIFALGLLVAGRRLRGTLHEAMTIGIQIQAARVKLCSTGIHHVGCGCAR